MIAALYAATVFLWGLTWYPLVVQAAHAPPFVAVLHRIGIAAAILLAVTIVRYGLPRRTIGDHAVFAGLGLCLFGFNFGLFYCAAPGVPSGLLAILFASSTVWAALLSRLFYGTPITGRHLTGALLGLAGLAILLRERAALDGATAAASLSLAIAGAVVFALGNIVAVQISRRRLPQIESVARGMTYGAAAMATTAAIRGESFALPESPAYWAAAGYLAVGGSAIAFTVYVALVTRVGAPRAAYATVLAPLLALAVSAGVEGFRPTPWTAIGVAAVLAGAALALRKPSAAPGAPAQRAAEADRGVGPA